MEEREEAYQESRKLREKDNQILNDLLPPEEELGVVSPNYEDEPWPEPKLSSTAKVKTGQQARGVTKPMTKPKSRDPKKTVNSRSTPASRPVIMDNMQETLDISECKQERYSNHLDVSHAEPNHESISDWFADVDEDFMTSSDAPALQQTHHGKDGIGSR